MKVVDAAAVADELARRAEIRDTFVGGVAQHPATLTRALVAAAGAQRPCTVTAPLAGSATPLTGWSGREGRVVLTHSVAGFEVGLADGWASFRSVHVSELARQVRSRDRGAVFVRCTPPDADGRCHLGSSVDVTLDAVRGSDFVVAELSSELPRAGGDCVVFADEIDLAVTVDDKAAAQRSSRPAATPVEVAVAARVAELVPDGATVEIGIGRIAAAITNSLETKHGLKLHTGTITREVVDLLASGAVVDRAAEPFLAPVAAIMADDDPVVRVAIETDERLGLFPVSRTHDRRALGELPALHAVNSALEIDLTGALNCEHVNGRRVAAVGGLLDFREGARISPGGRFVVALTSTTRSGASRIVPRLSCPASMPAVDAAWVVTEYGAVDLAPLDEAQRAAALVELAHPDHRARLSAASHGASHEQ